MILIHARGIYSGANSYTTNNGILVNGDRIIEIGDFETLRKFWGKEAIIIDLNSLYLFPGLVNTHVHLEFDSTTSARMNYVNQSAAVKMGRALAQAQTLLLSGVTTVRDAGSSWEMLDISDPSLRALYKLPRFQLCGPPITVTGGHLNFMGCEADSKDEIIKSVRLHQKRGCNAIKIIVTGGQMTPGSLPERVSYTAEHIRALVEESKRLGLPTMAHCLTTEGFVNSMIGGVDSIEHCAFFRRNSTNNLLERIYEPTIIEAFAGEGRYFMNGLSASYHTFDRLREGLEEPTDAQRFLLEQEERMFIIFQKLVDLGMKPVVGTDAGVANTFFDETWLELELMCSRGGLNNVEAIEAATTNGAACLGLSHEIGKIQKGYKADIIGLSSDPLSDIRAFRQVNWIMCDGIIVKQ